MRCLSCEIHVVYRIVLRFTKEAVIAGRQFKLLTSFVDKGGLINWTMPKFTKGKNGRTYMSDAVATILMDVQLPNQQKRTVKAFAESYKKLINADDIDEGFIEIHEVSDVVELINWEEAPVCKPKPKKKAAARCKKCGLVPDLCMCKEKESE